MSRPQKPKQEGANPVDVLLNIPLHYFRSFWDKVKKIKDRRRAASVIYPIDYIVATELLKFFSYIKSNNQMDLEFDKNGNIAKVIKEWTGTSRDLSEIPRGDTINKVLKNLEESDFRKILYYMFDELRDGKRLEPFREPITGGYLFAIDGTGGYSSKKEFPCSTKRQHSDGTITHHAYIVSMSLVGGKNIALPFDLEFVKNNKPERDETFSKQDCEYNAANVLLKRFHDAHPRIKLTILGDALFLARPLLKKICEYGWYFCISYKEGISKNLNFLIEMNMKHAHTYSFRDGLLKHNVKWCKIDQSFGEKDEGFTIPAFYVEDTIEVYDENGDLVSSKTFKRITNIPLSEYNIKDFCKHILRKRWNIENGQFNEEKNLGLNFEHPYALSGNAMEISYILNAIAFIFIQLAKNTTFAQEISKMRGLCRAAPTLLGVIGKICCLGSMFLQSLKTLPFSIMEKADIRPRWDPLC